MTEWLTLEGIRSIMVVLVVGLATIIFRYGWFNFRLEPERKRFLTYITLTSIAVLVVIVANNLLLFWLGWVSISLGLHQLLLFYPDRLRAQLAAHKKFVFSRLAELTLGLAFAVIYFVTGDMALTSAQPSFLAQASSLQLNLVACLLAATALLKCAQMPFHGWLIQVVEAPTPVSALLHAGIINLGGFLLLINIPILEASSAAQWLLLVVSAVSLGLATLIMATRISIKVQLAWSTCAQMGWMLLEIALGYYALAALHLLAHSVYKAHSFLGSGQLEMNPKQAMNSKNVNGWLLAATIVVVFALMWLVKGHAYFTAALMVTAMLVSVFTPNSRYFGTLHAVCLFAIYLVFSLISEHGLLASDAPALAKEVFASIAVLAIFVAQRILLSSDFNNRSQALFVWLNAGGYIDEHITRWVLAIWPQRVRGTR
ncbi:NADH-quinone oxidoreductase subunit L [Idiomarina tyrosinivorans]|nr:NADH-quinone oxidoreductase subunit L [Idiomarina tyrosinivorans]